jgi:Yip1 domain
MSPRARPGHLDSGSNADLAIAKTRERAPAAAASGPAECATLCAPDGSTAMEDAMTFGDRVVGAMKLDPNAFEDVERDPTAIGQSVGVITLAAVAAGIGRIYDGGLTGIVGGALMSIIGFLIWSLIIWLVGVKVMPEPATKADYPETFRVLGFAAAPGLASVLTIIGIIPILGWLLAWLIMCVIWVWQIAAMVIAVRQVLDYSTTGKAVIVVLIGFAINMIVTMVLLTPLLIASLLTR